MSATAIDAGDLIHTTIWSEQAESDNPFATRRALCRGYDVYGEMVGKARWVEMLFLLLRDRLPGPAALDMLEALAVGLANPGPRDPSVHAAMCGGVGGSAAAASLIAALSVGAGRNGGAREVFDAMSMWHSCGRDLSAWALETGRAPGQPIEIWPEREHVPGFDPHGVSTATVVRQLLCTLARIGATAQVNWLLEHLDLAQQTIGRPLAMSGVAACVFVDLGLSPAEGEMLYLLLRLPGAAAHALEQTENGFRRFPFYRMELDEALCPEAA